MATRSFLGGLVAGTMLGAALTAMMIPRLREEMMDEAGQQMEQMLRRGRQMMRESMSERRR